MATLFNTKISATYEGLFKTIDNAAITASLKELTDGSGNQSGLYVNTAGDFKVSNILEWGSLKDTGTGVTITRYVTSTDGIENFDNNTSLPTSAAVKLYVDSKFATSDTLQEVLSFGNTTGGNDIVVSASDDITFTDTSKILMGASSDFQIYHDGSNSFIKDLGTGNLKIQSDGLGIDLTKGSTEFLAKFIIDGANELYYNNVKRLETTTAGAEVTGNLVVTGTITGAGGSFLPLAGGTMTGNIVLNDNVKTSYGTSADFEIFHNASTNSNFIQSNLSRQLILAQDNIFIGNQAASESMITAIADAAVSLFYDNSKKFETTNTGATVTGALTTTTDVIVGANATFVDNGKAIFGAGSDLQIYHNGTNQDKIESLSSFLILESSNLILRNNGGSEDYAKFFGNGGAELYYDNIKRLETVTAGAKVTGNLEVTGTITGSGGSFLPLAGGTMTGNTIHNDNVKSIYGTGSDLLIYHDGSHSYIEDSGTGNLRIDAQSLQVRKQGSTENIAGFAADGAVTLYYNNSKKFETTNIGVQVSGSIEAIGGSIFVYDGNEFRAGDAGDLRIGHDATNSYLKNNTGDLYIDQAAVTQSIFFRVSDANSLDTTALTISRNADASFGRNVTIAGDLTVNGTTTTVNSQTLAVVDPLIQLAKDNTANSLDIGLYGDYNDGTDRFLGLFSDASDSNKFKLFKGTTVEPTTTVNIGATGYVAADLQVAGLEATTGTFTSTLTVNTANSNILTLNRTTSAGGYMRFQNDGTDKFYIGSRSVVSGDGGTGYDIYSAGGNDIRFFAGTLKTLTLDTSANATFTGDISLSAGKKLKYNANSFITPENNTSGAEISTAGTFIVKTGSTPTLGLTIDASQNSTFAGKILVGTGATAAASLNAYTQTVSANLYSALRIIENSGASSYWDIGATGGGSPDLNFYVNGGTTPKLKIDSSGNSTFAGNVTVGTGLQLYTDGSGNGVIYNLGQDKDLYFVVDDGGTGVNALVFDSSNGGAATFAGNVKSNSTTAFSVGTIGNIGNTAGDINIYSTSSGHNGLRMHANGILPTDNAGTIIDNDADLGFPTYRFKDLYLGGSITSGGGATFAGNITASRGFFNAGATNVVATFTSTDATSTLQCIDGVGNVEFGANGNDFVVQPAGGVAQLTVGSSSSTFAGSVTVNGSQDALTINTTDTDGPYAVWENTTNAALGYVGNANSLASAGNTNFAVRATNDLIFAAGGGTERMRLLPDGGGSFVIIKAQSGTYSSLAALSLYGTNSATYGGSVVSRSSILSQTDGSAFGANLIFKTNDTSNIEQERMRIDSSGNVLIGPQALDIQIKAASNNSGKNLIYLRGNAVGDKAEISLNHFGSANMFIGVGTTAATVMSLTATSGGTDGIIIDTSGNVGIGTDSPDKPLELSGASGSAVLRLTNTDSTVTLGESLGSIEFQSNDASTPGGTGTQAVINVVDDNSFGNAYSMTFSTALAGTLAERMRITSGGDVLVSNASAFTIGTHDPNVITQATFGVNNGSNVASYGLDRIHFDSSNYFVLNASAVGVKLVNGATAWTAQSDESLKENIKPLNNVLDKIKDYRCVEYNLKANKNKKIGFIAQDWENDFSPIVNKDDEGLLGMKYTETIPVLLKAIQELKAEVDLLKQNCNCKN